ncbi:hypothetical protein [Amycolatopsis keratiniphila]|uniref:Uncharacterized protein n=1 Tax=Amycolatopsis keratiniphila subsp. keratiniphila TaxID=227715 RepID=A0A1W2LS36_9PSEU|nr:hypothetical protein [Amycolatopsis keratiniphila]OLZ59606.1 hypothetical protein BS330_04245 [Amycolatopsis keratiniphila subsp. nogabecina]ONF66926.1 hypothetical protein AVR91_0223540 [Amycolatopsis keratiniphila subsp. keratiniphila]SDU54206.1 hypothetical protein SAMN04489733_5760 [Amycolatopsis keratiniphila]
MSSQGSVVVAAIAGIATGLLVAALLVAGREPQRRVYEVGTTPAPTSTSRSVGPVTVTVPASTPEPLVVTRTRTPAPRTVTRTVTPSPTSTELPPSTTTGFRSD